MFQLHPKSVVHDPQVPGLLVLIECLAQGKTIRSSQQAATVISTRQSATQWLECETSGSTGEPKIIRRTPGSWIRSFEISKSLFEAGSEDHYAVLGSIGHSLGLYSTLEALHLGADVSILTGLTPAKQWEAIEERAVTILYATPTQLRLLCELLVRSNRSHLPKVRRVFVGGGILHDKNREALPELFPNADIQEFYGTSETSFVSIGSKDTPMGSVGRPYPGVELKIAKANEGDLHGELHVRSPLVADRYVGSEMAPIVHPDGFVHTGEVGYQDQNGFIFLRGRLDRMFTVSDVNVFPEAIEQTIISMEGVVACAVVGVPDGSRGNRIVCFIEQDTSAIDAPAIRSHCRRMLGSHHVPKEIVQVSSLPTLPSGKPDIKTLETQAMSGR